MAIFRHASETRFEFGVGQLKNNELRILRFRGTEAISQLYHFDLELVSDDASVDFKAVIGQEATLLIGAENTDRNVNGIISRFEQGAVGKRFTRYYAELVPRQWMLLQRVNTRIFQNKSVVEIVEQVMTDAGLPGDSWRKVNLGSYKPREYCVQYGESDWTFISRLLEEEGIFYFFAHEEGDHALLLGDKPAAHVPIDGVAKIPFRDAAGMDVSSDHIRNFRRGEAVQPGAVLLRNFSFKMPKANLDAKQKAQDFEELEVYEYDQGAFATADLGKQWARVRLEEQQARRKTASGSSTVERLTPGYRFTLDEHSRSDFNVEYLLTEVRHEGYEPEALEQYAGARETSGEEEYANQFRCIPYDVPFRPPRATPRPYIRGTQTATVVGPAGSEIYTDEYARVKLHFHWDRYGSLDEQSSCWVRVSQQVAGGGFGFLALPRVGHEVVVAFLEGDPDQPLVVGRVYNQDNMPPYELPTHKTQTVIKTNSYDQNGFNEIRFEDKGGEEQLFLFAQRNLDMRVQSSRYESVGKEYHRTVEQNEYTFIKNERHTKVGVDDKTAIGGDQHLEVFGKRAAQIDGSDSLTVMGDRIEQFTNHSEATTGTLYMRGLNVVVESMVGLTLKTGASSVVIDNVGVTLTAPFVTINGGLTLINSGPGSPAGEGSAETPVSPLDPSEAEPADDSDPGKMTEAKAYQQETGTGKYGKRSLTPYHATQEEKKNPKKTWIEIELVDEEGKPVPGEAYEVTLPDGTQVARGSLDHKGFARIEGIDPGSCKVTFPRLDKDAWERT